MLRGSWWWDCNQFLHCFSAYLDRSGVNGDSFLFFFIMWYSYYFYTQVSWVYHRLAKIFLGSSKRNDFFSAWKPRRPKAWVEKTHCTIHWPVQNLIIPEAGFLWFLKETKDVPALNTLLSCHHHSHLSPHCHSKAKGKNSWEGIRSDSRKGSFSVMDIFFPSGIHPRDCGWDVLPVKTSLFTNSFLRY